MIGLKQISEGCIGGEHGEVLQRKRTPSKYAESIREFKKTTVKLQRKAKNTDFDEEQSQPANRINPQSTNTLTCFLPKSKRNLKLHIIIKKCKNIPNKPHKSILSQPVIKLEPTEQPKNPSLLDSLFKLCEQHKLNLEKEKESQIKQESHFSSQSVIQKRRYRKGKQDEEKYERMYEKYRNLTEKMDQMESQTLFI